MKGVITGKAPEDISVGSIVAGYVQAAPRALSRAEREAFMSGMSVILVMYSCMQVAEVSPLRLDRTMRRLLKEAQTYTLP